MPGNIFLTDEVRSLATLRAPIDKIRFQSAIRRLHSLFAIYSSTTPVPLPAPWLIITPAIRTQSELYLPIADIAAVFKRLYCAALTYPPIFSSTPFHNAMSWADAFGALPSEFQLSANPARLLEALLDDDDLLNRFLFASFLPRRFYGTIGRYPGQWGIIRKWLNNRGKVALHCLDAACGTGEDTYGLALFLSERGFSPDETEIEGWTIEPLEVWAATHRRFPHDRQREVRLRAAAGILMDQGFCSRIRFRCADLTQSPLNPPLPKGEEFTINPFDLILCNGLLGGPIIHQREQLDRITGTMVRLLAPGGLLLAADNFHGGWKRHCPHGEMRAVWEKYGLNTFPAGEGIGGLKLD